MGAVAPGFLAATMSSTTACDLAGHGTAMLSQASMVPGFSLLQVPSTCWLPATMPVSQFQSEGASILRHPSTFSTAPPMAPHDCAVQSNGQSSTSEVCLLSLADAIQEPGTCKSGSIFHTTSRVSGNGSDKKRYEQRKHKSQQRLKQSKALLTETSRIVLGGACG